MSGTPSVLRSSLGRSARARGGERVWDARKDARVRLSELPAAGIVVVGHNERWRQGWRTRVARQELQVGGKFERQRAHVICLATASVSNKAGLTPSGHAQCSLLFQFSWSARWPPTSCICLLTIGFQKHEVTRAHMPEAEMAVAVAGKKTEAVSSRRCNTVIATASLS